MNFGVNFEIKIKRRKYAFYIGGRSKRVQSLKRIDIKNMFSILNQMDEESNIVRDREDGTNIVLGDSS